ncbi:hypothetical protein AB0L40_25710 [Patulibacter sp. NPDC049589]|uniref:hypothetical protein n=1 Tax=Patulibacter sp. NPDC049589 TaxID=3154731 RepID=UPI003425A7AD
MASLPAPPSSTAPAPLADVAFTVGRDVVVQRLTGARRRVVLRVGGDGPDDLALRHDGRRLAVADERGVRVVDLAHPARAARLPLPRGTFADGVAWSPDGRGLTIADAGVSGPTTWVDCHATRPYRCHVRRSRVVAGPVPSPDGRSTVTIEERGPRRTGGHAATTVTAELVLHRGGRRRVLDRASTVRTGRTTVTSAIGPPLWTAGGLWWDVSSQRVVDEGGASSSEDAHQERRLRDDGAVESFAPQTADGTPVTALGVLPDGTAWGEVDAATNRHEVVLIPADGPATRTGLRYRIPDQLLLGPTADARFAVVDRRIGPQQEVDALRLAGAGGRLGRVLLRSRGPRPAIDLR